MRCCSTLAGSVSPCSDDQAAQRIAELAGHFLPHRLALEVAKADAPIGRRLGEEDAPAIVGQLDVVEVRPAGGVDADRGAQVDLMVILEALRSHVAPPVEIRRLPVLERAQQPLVAREVDVVGNAFVELHGHVLQTVSYQLPVAQFKGQLLELPDSSLN